MQRQWIHESPARWDETKEAVVGRAPKGAISHVDGYRRGGMLPGDWWRVEEGGRVAGYGWMDHTWGDAEILLAVHPEAQKQGVGAWILDRLEGEARSRGLNYMYNVVPSGHPDASGLTGWLEKHGFQGSHEPGLLRRAVKRTGA